MADTNAVLTAFRAELITAGLVRRPSEAGAAGVPPMHIEPVDGPPAPGEREGIEDDPELVLTLDLSSEVAGARGYETALELVAIVDVHYRTVGAGPGKNPSAALRRARGLNAAITARLIRPATNYGIGFDLGGLLVLEVNEFAGYGRVSADRERGYHDLAKYVVKVPRG
jgi:hypothetical protein